jgi:DeoR/GlpR family transcriptional regulator of sugar metabolism
MSKKPSIASVTHRLRWLSKLGSFSLHELTRLLSTSENTLRQALRYIRLENQK